MAAGGSWRQHGRPGWFRGHRRRVRKRRVRRCHGGRWRHLHDGRNRWRRRRQRSARGGGRRLGRHRRWRSAAPAAAVRAEPAAAVPAGAGGGGSGGAGGGTQDARMETAAGCPRRRQATIETVLRQPAGGHGQLSGRYQDQRRRPDPLSPGAGDRRSLRHVGHQALGRLPVRHRDPVGQRLRDPSGSGHCLQDLAPQLHGHASRSITVRRSAVRDRGPGLRRRPGRPGIGVRGPNVLLDKVQALPTACTGSSTPCRSGGPC